MWPSSSGTQGQSVGSGQKGGMKVFKYRRKSPWVPTLTELFPKIQADAGSWLGTKNALYYCAQSANSLSWVLFVSSYTTTIIVAITACMDHAPKKCTQSGNFQFDIKSPSDFKILSTWKLKTLFQKHKLELTKGIHACIGHVLHNYLGVFKRYHDGWRTATKTSHWKVNSQFFSLYHAYSNSLTLLNASALFWSWISINHIRVHEENEFCHCLFTSFTKGEIRHFHE